MAEATQEKLTGLKFAEQQLLRHGWEKGKGLGRRENGIVEAIKVQMKCDKRGIGHEEGEEFSFHWWDHVFNKASSSLVVESGQDGVIVKVADDSNNGLISNKKPRKAQQAKYMLYGCFVKSATLLSGQKHTVKANDSDDSSSSSPEDEDKELDHSSINKLSDAVLLKACGGRTAHKGARHGLTMSAKLARLEQQEQEFMNKYGKKNPPAGTCPTSQVCNNDTSLIHKDDPDDTEKTKRICDSEGSDVEDSKLKKDKDTNASVNGDMMIDAEPRKKKKRTRKDKVQTEESFNNDCCSEVNEASEAVHEESASGLSMKENITKKEKKKKRLAADVSSEDFTENHPQEGFSELQETSDNVSKKRRRKKSAMNHYEASPSTDSTVVTIIEDTNTEEQNMDMETDGQKRNRKKNKKKKVREMEDREVVEQVSSEDSGPKKKKSKN